MSPCSSLVITAPNGDKQSIVFNQATDAQLEPCLHLYASAFGRPLSTADRIQNEALFRDLPLNRNNAMRTWCLSLADNPSEVVCMCKTVPRDLLIRDNNGTSVEKGFCIASVVTAEAYRGKGLAAFMLKEVAAWLDGPGDAIASMLYSSVGSFYVDKGWDLLSPMQAAFSVDFESVSVKEKLPPTSLLENDRLPDLCERDIERLDSRFASHDISHDQVLMTVLPSLNVITVQHDRDLFFGAKLGCTQPITHRGSICGEDGPWLYWYYDHRDDQMCIQRISITLAQEKQPDILASLASLLLDAKNEATRLGLQRVVIWNPADIVVKALRFLADETGATFVLEERKRDVPSVRWKHGDKTRAIEVVPNEFYAWN